MEAKVIITTELQLKAIVADAINAALKFYQPFPEANHADEVGGIQLACEVTRLSKPRIYALVSERAIPHAKRGNRLHFNRTDLLAWVAQGHRAEKGGPDA